MSHAVRTFQFNFQFHFIASKNCLASHSVYCLTLIHINTHPHQLMRLYNRHQLRKKHKIYLFMHTLLEATTQRRPVEPTCVHVNKVNTVSCGNVHMDSAGLIGCWHVIKISVGIQSAPNVHWAESPLVSKEHKEQSLDLLIMSSFGVPVKIFVRFFPP